MEDTLKRLLAAEAKASAKALEAEQAAAALRGATREEIAQMDARFARRLPELRAGHLEKAEERAAQAVKEMERRHADHLTQLRARAQSHEEDALEAAFDRLMGPF